MVSGGPVWVLVLRAVRGRARRMRRARVQRPRDGFKRPGKPIPTPVPSLSVRIDRSRRIPVTFGRTPFWYCAFPRFCDDLATAAFDGWG